MLCYFMFLFHVYINTLIQSQTKGEMFLQKQFSFFIRFLLKLFFPILLPGRNIIPRKPKKEDQQEEEEKRKYRIELYLVLYKNILKKDTSQCRNNTYEKKLEKFSLLKKN